MTHVYYEGFVQLSRQAVVSPENREMARTVLTVLGVIIALLGVIYQLHFKPILTTFGWGRVIEDCEIYSAS